MANLHNLYKKQVEAWKERFISQRNDGVPVVFKVGEKVDDLLLSRHKDTIELLEAEIERKKQMMKPDSECSGMPSEPECDHCGYNSAIDEDIAYLEGELQKLKNEQ